ncbi:MAG TPA: superoxide dismutase family protein [Gammaproteobacteria bacterium]
MSSAMSSKSFLHCLYLIGVAALVVGCGPDSSDRQGAERGGGAQGRPGDSGLSRNEPRPTPGAQAPGAADRDAAVRPPTTVPNPAEPGSAAAPSTPQLVARAEIQPLADHTARGIVEFQQAPPGSSGPMSIHVMLMGLDAGPHGMHVHMGTDCMDPGMHLNPQNAPHGPANAASGMRHLGDLGNVTADASGMVDETLRDSLLGSDMSFIGKVLIVHEGQDDLSTQPDGSSGQPVGCGVVEAAGEDILSRGPAQDRGV